MKSNKCVTVPHPRLHS